MIRNIFQTQPRFKHELKVVEISFPFLGIDEEHSIGFTYLEQCFVFDRVKEESMNCNLPEHRGLDIEVLYQNILSTTCTTVDLEAVEHFAKIPHQKPVIFL